MNYAGLNNLKTDDSPDFIWTHIKSANGYKRIYWIPYLQEIKEKSAGKWHLKYHGGVLDLDLNLVDSIMIYGKDGTVSIEFLNECIKFNVLVILHKRTSKDIGVFYNGNTSASTANLVNQIIARENKIKSCYIAKVLVKYQIQQRQEFLSFLGKEGYFMSSSFFKRLSACKSVESVRYLESQAALKYWNMFFKYIESSVNTKQVTNPFHDISSATALPLQLDNTRRGVGPVQDALNAGSVFLTGVILRWIVLHRLSPAHGYLHVDSSYEGLVFDLIEPFRWIIELSVLKAVESGGLDLLVSRSIENIKALLESSAYFNTGQTSLYKTAMHGIVLSLIAYLKGSSPRFVVPVKTVPSKKLRKPLFRMPGPPQQKKIKTPRNQ